MNELRTPPARRQDVPSLLSNPVPRADGDSSWIREKAVQVVWSLSGPATQPTLTSPSAHTTLEAQLYRSGAACKIKTAAIAMHLDKDWRARFFAQVDSLLSADDWDKHDTPPTEASFTTLLRLILLIRAKRRPGLGATGDGNAIAGWTVGKDRLTVECLPADEVRWVLVRYLDGERESAAGQTTLLRLLKVLDPYDPGNWFADDGSKDPI